MIRFYFNECLENRFGKNLQEMLEEMILRFVTLQKDKDLGIEPGIITQNMPSETNVCGTDLSVLVNAITDRDLKRAALRCFTKYPIDSYTLHEELFNDELALEEFYFEGIDATNLLIAFKMNWILFSLPLHQQLEQDTIEINSIESRVSVHNWYGNNNDYIVGRIAQISDLTEEALTRLKYIFRDKKCVLSPAFMDAYKRSAPDEQNSISQKFKDAQQALLLFPAVSDDNIVKLCQGVGSGDLYELRLRPFGGIRVYFTSDEDTLYIGGMGKKSQYKGGAQSADMSRAAHEILKLKK